MKGVTIPFLGSYMNTTCRLVEMESKWCMCTQMRVGACRESQPKQIHFVCRFSYFLFFSMMDFPYLRRSKLCSHQVCISHGRHLHHIFDVHVACLICVSHVWHILCTTRWSSNFLLSNVYYRHLIEHRACIYRSGSNCVNFMCECAWRPPLHIFINSNLEIATTTDDCI